MSKYEIQDAYKLKVFMQEIQTIADKYPNGAGIHLKDIPEELKQAIEFIDEMVKADARK